MTPCRWSICVTALFTCKLTDHTQLLDPRWVELFLAKLKDLAGYQDKKAKLGGKGKRAEEFGTKGTKTETAAKGRGKTGKKGKKEGAENLPSAATADV